MKKIMIITLTICLSACGTILVKSNDEIKIQNNSNEVITANGDMGTIKIAPSSYAFVQTNETIHLTNPNPDCNSPTIQRTANVPAIILDIFPGFFFGIIPIVVDAVSGNLYEIPKYHYYSCN